jgi:hypothetical protein
MATTTNYSWTTPDDTALVKDGAAAIRSLGTSIDTTTKNLNPSTTLGDIEYRSSTANTNTRLGIGTSGQVLSVSGGVPAWVTASSGGMTLLSTTTLSGATVTISSINQTYKTLYMVIFGVTNATGNGAGSIKPNAASNATWLSMESTSAGTTQTSTGVNQPIQLNQVQTKLRTDANNAWTLTIDNYASTTAYKPFELDGQYLNSSSFNAAIMEAGAIQTNSAITSLEFSWSNGNLSTGTVLLYGVN